MDKSRGWTRGESNPRSSGANPKSVPDRAQTTAENIIPYMPTRRKFLFAILSVIAAGAVAFSGRFDIARASSEAGASESSSGGVLSSLGINPTLFLFQLANFIVVALILWFLILKPLTQKMSERQKIIDESLQNADKLKAKLAKSEEDYMARLAAAQREAEKILEKANHEGEQLSAELKEKAKGEIAKLAAEGKKQIASDKEEMLRHFKAEAADLVVLALEKVLAEKVDEDKDKKFIKGIIEKLGT